MALKGGSKPSLDTPSQGPQPSLVHRLATLALIGLVTHPLPASQAPQGANLWRLAGTALARPPALVGGSTGKLWNPSPLLDGQGTTIGVQVLQTPDVIGLNGAIAGITAGLGPHWEVAAIGGRMDVEDLVRTSTSPVSDGTIPIYTQFIGTTIGIRTGILSVGALVALHDTRFDLDHSNGVTTDLGIRVMPIERFTISAATHWFPADWSNQENTDFFVGAQYAIREAPIWGARARVTARYGLTAHRNADVDHAVGLGLVLDDQFAVDGAWARETAFGNSEWRPELAVAIRIGHYTIAVGRGGGISGLGPTYRVGLDLGAKP